MPWWLRQLELAGCIVTVDALNTQKDIAREIKEADAEDVLALKGNHPLLHEEVRDFLLDARQRHFVGTAHDFFGEADKGHARWKIRRHWSTEHIAWITPRAEWEGLRGVGLVERERHPSAGVRVERAFFLCPIAPAAKLFARAVRGHWGVENSLHWRLDVIFSRRSEPGTHALCRRQPGRLAQARPQRGPSGQEPQGRRQRQTLPRRYQR